MTAWGRASVLGSLKPTGFKGPKRSVSGPRSTITSIGKHDSKYLGFRICARGSLGCCDGLYESIVFGFCEGDVQIVSGFLLAIAIAEKTL